MLSFDSPASVAHPHPHPAPDSTPAIFDTSMASASASSTGPANGKAQHHILLVTGPAGCGKTTVAEHIATSIGMPYIEGDSYHPQANIDKMSSGIPLTDADRWDWLALLREEATSRINAGASGVVVTCSALKRKYRDVMRVAAYFDRSIRVHFIFLDAPEEVLLQRVMARKNHYMGANMVQSQFSILERPGQDECDVSPIDVSREMEEVTTEALARVREILNEDGA